MDTIYNKITVNGKTLIDISSDTVDTEHLIQGYTAHDASGVQITGTATEGGSSAALIVDTTDSHGGIIREITTDTEVKLEGAKTVTPTSSRQTITPSQGYDGFSSVIVEASSGGEPALKKQINFIDYDGTILYSYSASEWANVSALPDNPTHSGLTAQGWNWTKPQIDAQLTDMPDGDVWVGQMYITDDGKTRIYIHLEEGRLHPYLGICPNGTVVVDWGDGSETVTLTGTSLTTVRYADHTYASGGDYMITLTVSSGSFAFYGSTNTSNILKKDTTTTLNIHLAYTNAIHKIELGNNVSVNTYAFTYCQSLASITIPNSVTSIGNYAFDTCPSLKSITIPSGITSIGNYIFRNCYSFTSIAIPSGVTSIGSYAFNNCYPFAGITIPSGATNVSNRVFYNCYSLTNITIPSGITAIADSVLYGCHSLANITIPSGITSIGSNAFRDCYGVAEYHLLPTTPPTLSGTAAFTSIASDCKIYVPSESLEAYQTATNWSTYASYMVGE